MSEVIVGLDVGGTKTAVIVETVDGVRLVEATLPSDEWDAEPLEDGIRWVADRIARVVPAGDRVVAVGLGAQGLDSNEIAESFSAGLREFGYLSIAVNDAALLVAAAGFTTGIGVISGTGSIGVGQDASGDYVVTGGWGWVIGDEAGAAGLVREATRAALRAHDDLEPDDGLLSALLAGFGVDSAERLARAVNDEPTMDNWGPHAPAVFAAADAGSSLARAIIENAAGNLATLVDQLIARGAIGTDVVAAGSVIVNQPRLFDSFRSYVLERHPSYSVHLLERAPVEGAVALARRILPA